MSNTKKVQKENIWNNILKECNRENKYQNKNLLILGNQNSGKRTLLNSLLDVSNTKIPLKKNDQQNGKLGLKESKSLLDFIYINSQDLEDADNEMRAYIRCYVIDEIEQLDLLGIIMDSEFIENMIMVINLDFEEPFGFMNQLGLWIDAISKKMTSIDIKLEVQDKIRQKLKTYVANWREVQFDENNNIIQYESNPNIPLKDGVLSTSFGFPIIIVVNKSDMIDEFIKEKEGPQKFDYILYSLRNYSITYGACLFYLSSKQKYNLKLFYDYLLHRFYNFPLKDKAEVMAKESIFIPSGFDSKNIINQCFPIQQFQKCIYEDFIKQPESKQKVLHKEELLVPDNQTFFQELKIKYENNNNKDDKGDLSSYANFMNLNNKKTDINNNNNIRKNVEAEFQNHTRNTREGTQNNTLNSKDAERILQILKNPNRDNK